MLIVSKNSNLIFMKYLHSISYPVNEKTCYNAYVNGHLDCIEFAHKIGCPWNG
jgi:hypothetical protein